jgi:hypothetical protein
MSNYHNKYLKYKKKYIDLKNEYEGGSGDGIYVFLWSSSNKAANDVFNKISEGFKEFLSIENNDLNKPYYIKSDLKTDLNYILNIFTYKLGDNKVVPFFELKFKEDKQSISYDKKQKLNGSTKKIEYSGEIKTQSNRFDDKMKRSFEKSINKYLESSVIYFNEEKKLIINRINCETLKLQIDKIINFINIPDKLNPDERNRKTKTLLEMTKLFQDLSIQEVNQQMKHTIGVYGDLITNPSGIEGALITKKELKRSSEESTLSSREFVKKKKNETFNDYLTKNIEIDLYLTIPSKFKYFNIDRAMVFKLVKDKYEVLNIFPNNMTTPAKNGQPQNNDQNEKNENEQNEQNE